MVLTPNMHALDELRAVQLSAKLSHAWKRLRTIELAVRARLPHEASASDSRTLIAARAELTDCIRYLLDIEGEFPRTHDEKASRSVTD